MVFLLLCCVFWKINLKRDCKIYYTELFEFEVKLFKVIVLLLDKHCHKLCELSMDDQKQPLISK